MTQASRSTLSISCGFEISGAGPLALKRLGHFFAPPIFPVPRLVD